MGIAQDLVVAARRWKMLRGTLPAPASEQAAAERAQLREWFASLRRSAPAGLLRGSALFDVEAAELPWVDSGLDLHEGEEISTFAAGRVVLSDALDLWVGPQFQLWMRIGEEGRVFNGTRDSHSFRVPQAGRLYLAGYFPGQWGDPGGRVSTSLRDYGKFRGGISVAVLRWSDGAAQGLAACNEIDASGRIAAELARMSDPVPAPEGWSYLWFLGESEIFRRASVDGHDCIACHTERNVSILQHDAVFDLKPGTRLRWKWKVDELPSLLPENTAASHDYLSVAVEFENGRDMTYTWSRELASGTAYWCPLPTWKDREFHVVVRSGSGELGRWLDEERDLFADYSRWMGTPPRRVLRIWLIAVSIFQRRQGRAAFAGFELDGGDGRRLAID